MSDLVDEAIKYHREHDRFEQDYIGVQVFDSVYDIWRHAARGTHGKRMFDSGRPKRWRWVTPEPTPGQMLFKPSRNLIVVDEPKYRDENITVRTYGCDHNYTTVEKRNCYRRNRCTRCGYEWAVDSGD